MEEGIELSSWGRDQMGMERGIEWDGDGIDGNMRMGMGLR